MSFSPGVSMWVRHVCCCKGEGIYVRSCVYRDSDQCTYIDSLWCWCGTRSPRSTLALAPTTSLSWIRSVYYIAQHTWWYSVASHWYCTTSAHCEVYPSKKHNDGRCSLVQPPFFGEVNTVFNKFIPYMSHAVWVCGYIACDCASVVCMTACV